MNNDSIKQGAYYLLRGGTLLSEPCKKCGNLQIKYKQDVICMNCQNTEQGKTELQKTVANDIETETEASKADSKEEDKGITNVYSNINDVLSEIERQVLLTLVKLNKEQDTLSSPKKYKKYLKIVQTSLKTVEMIKSIKQTSI
ncbi:Sjogren's syndrome/scleroderma autoantigen 1 family protein [Candidatus Nitrosocosmicus sp. T]